MCLLLLRQDLIVIEPVAMIAWLPLPLSFFPSLLIALRLNFVIGASFLSSFFRSLVPMNRTVRCVTQIALASAQPPW